MRGIGSICVIFRFSVYVNRLFLDYYDVTTCGKIWAFMKVRPRCCVDLDDVEWILLADSLSRPACETHVFDNFSHTAIVCMIGVLSVFFALINTGY